jgi:hypothetical protein
MLKCGIFVSRCVLELKQGCDSVIISKPCCDPNQLLNFERDGTIRSNNGKVLDIRGGNKEPVTPLIASPKHGGWNQIFRVIPVSGEN